MANYLTIIPLARMGSESAFSLTGYWLRGHDGKRNNYLSKIQLVGQKYRDKTTKTNIETKRDSASIVLVFKAGALRY